MNAGRELDALVAEKVMDWEVDGAVVGIPQVKVHFPGFDTPSHWPPPMTDQGHRHCHRFSTDIAAAWEVVEKLISLGAAVSLFSHEVLPGYAGTVLGDVLWSVEVVPDGNKPRPITTSSSEAVTAPHAICLAALATLKGV